LLGLLRGGGCNRQREATREEQRGSESLLVIRHIGDTSKIPDQS